MQKVKKSNLAAIRRASALLDTQKGDADLRAQVMGIANQYPYQNSGESVTHLNALLDSLQATIPAEPEQPSSGGPNTQQPGISPKTGEENAVWLVALLTLAAGALIAGGTLLANRRNAKQQGF